MEQSFAVVAVALIGIVVLFQLALVLGAPWGQIAWGGQNPGVLPTTLRVGSAVAILVLGFMAWIVLAAADLVGASPVPEEWLDVILWVIAGYFLLGTLANLASKSRPERWWALVSFASAVSVGLIALS
jgi:hypothetical protein